MPCPCGAKDCDDNWEFQYEGDFGEYWVCLDCGRESHYPQAEEELPAEPEKEVCQLFEKVREIEESGEPLTAGRFFK
ncbi:MAG: hypothetical protein ACYSW0_16070 [Planctomycetota bacterium]|jgi:hypothetical protein